MYNGSECMPKALTLAQTAGELQHTEKANIEICLLKYTEMKVIVLTALERSLDYPVIHASVSEHSRFICTQHSKHKVVFNLR